MVAKQKIVCVLYDDPVAGYPPQYARQEIPVLKAYPGGQTMPSPSAIDFVPGELLGSVSGGLGLRKFVESRGHSLIITADKDGPDSVLERELVDADVVISQPFWPAYITAERIAKAPDLRLAITAGSGPTTLTCKRGSIGTSRFVKSLTATASVSPSTRSCRYWRWSGTTFRNTAWSSKAVGISRTRYLGLTTSKG